MELGRPTRGCGYGHTRAVVGWSRDVLVGEQRWLDSWDVGSDRCEALRKAGLENTGVNGVSSLFLD